MSLSGRTYPLKFPHGRMQILYRSIENHTSIKDKTSLKKGMLGPYNTTVSPLLLLLVKRLLLLFFPCMHHIVIVVPLHCYHYIGFDYIVSP